MLAALMLLSVVAPAFGRERLKCTPPKCKFYAGCMVNSHGGMVGGGDRGGGGGGGLEI